MGETYNQSILESLSLTEPGGVRTLRKKRTRAKQIAQRGKLMSRMKFLCQIIVRDIARVEDDLQKSQRQEAFCAKAPPYISCQEN